MIEENQLTQIARAAAQETIALKEDNSTWQNTVLAIIGAVTLGGTILFWIIDARTDRKIQPFIDKQNEMEIHNKYLLENVQENATKLDSILEKMSNI